MVMSREMQQMYEFGCPECEGDIELYDTREDKKGGRYRCLNCGRDTTWAVGTAISVADSVKRLKEFVDRGIKAQQAVDKEVGK